MAWVHFNSFLETMDMRRYGIKLHSKPRIGTQKNVLMTFNLTYSVSETFSRIRSSSGDPCWRVLAFSFINATVTVTCQNARQNSNSSLGKRKKLNAFDFDMKSSLWKPRLPTSPWDGVCCSVSGFAYSWLPAVSPMDDITFIQISHPQDTTPPRDPNHLSNTLSQCVEQFFRALGEARRSLKKKKSPKRQIWS